MPARSLKVAHYPSSSTFSSTMPAACVRSKRGATCLGGAAAAESAHDGASAALLIMSSNISYRLARCVKVVGGYSFLLWNGPARAGDQIDVVVNTSGGTTPARPTIPFKEDLFWAQGVNLGLVFSW